MSRGARTALEHRLWTKLKEDRVEEARFCLACSGGADSVAMVQSFAAVLNPSKLVVAYVHHGEGGAGDFRDRAEVFVCELALRHGLRFESRRSSKILRAEADLRRIRRQFLEEIRQESECDWIVTAHHQEDVLETRLIRLLRGTGPTGLAAIRPKRGVWYRPFLDVSRLQLREGLGDWLEDPSNEDPRYLRNWLRNRWLPLLEKRRPGSLDSFSRSLEDLVQSLEVSVQNLPGPGFSRAKWCALSMSEQRRLVAHWLQLTGVTEFTRGQLEEIRRQLDNSRNEYSFKGAGCIWVVNAEQITLRRDPKKA